MDCQGKIKSILVLFFIAVFENNARKVNIIPIFSILLRDEMYVAPTTKGYRLVKNSNNLIGIVGKKYIKKYTIDPSKIDLIPSLSKFV